MTSRFEKFKARALARPAVRAEYDNLAEEFELLDEILKSRLEAGITQAEGEVAGPRGDGGRA